jgi:hypothetical protein
LYDPQSVGAKSYLAVAQELLRRIENANVTIAEPQTPASAAAPPAISADQEPTAPAATQTEGPEASTPASVLTDGPEPHSNADPLPEVTTHE